MWCNRNSQVGEDTDIDNDMFFKKGGRTLVHQDGEVGATGIVEVLYTALAYIGEARAGCIAVQMEQSRSITGNADENVVGGLPRGTICTVDDAGGAGAIPSVQA